MSGNPFRKQGQSIQPTSSSSAPPFTSDDQPTERGSAKVKRVRIETPPPLSPDSPYEDDGVIHRVSNESHEGSPPPSPDSPPPDNAIFPPPLDPYDPFNHSAATAELFPSHEVIENTRLNSETNVARRDSTGGIVNPFQRTLATIENTEPSESEAVDDEAESAAKSGKAHMDVDSFKRMLMTGNPGGASDTTASLNPSPRTSSNPGSYFPSSNPETSDTVKPVQDQSSKRPSESDKRKSGPPPPPPAHRHGKLVEPQRIPQTVAFDSFTPNETPIPPNQVSTPDAIAVSSTSTPTQTEQSKKKPPAPPLARRGGQINSNRNSLIRENSSSSVPQQPLASPPLPSPTTIKSTTSKAPPPPPARRGGPKPATSLETNPSQPDETSVPASSSRSSSVASKNRSSVQAHVQPPPPVPPPRGRNSSKSSLEGPPSLTDVDGSSTPESRPAGQDPYMQTGESSVEANPEPGSSNLDAGSKAAVSDADILADMDRLQAEVDALRAKYSGSKSS